MRMQENKVALITGINGQDGSYLAEFLLEKGYEVWGTVKRNSVAENQTSRLDKIYPQLLGKLQYADLTDLASLISVIQQCQPDEIYNLAAQSHVRISFDQPIYTAQATGVGTLNLLEAIRLTKPNVKMYQASSSEMFGNNIDKDGFKEKPLHYHQYHLMDVLKYIHIIFVTTIRILMVCLFQMVFYLITNHQDVELTL
jgi:GDPmannose 4,6-dehydratase